MSKAAQGEFYRDRLVFGPLWLESHNSCASAHSEQWWAAGGSMCEAGFPNDYFGGFLESARRETGHSKTPPAVFVECETFFWARRPIPRPLPA